VLVTIAAIAIALIGERLAHLPAVLGTEDPAVDEYVDERLRSVRSVNVVATATAPAYVFDCLTATVMQHGNVALHWAATLWALGALFVGVTWQLALMKRRPGAQELERWARLGG